MAGASAPGVNSLALLILPSALLFALFFFLPIGLMAVMSVLTGNPVVMPNVAFTDTALRAHRRPIATTSR